jgi:hypothetical protein
MGLHLGGVRLPSLGVHRTSTGGRDGEEGYGSHVTQWEGEGYKIEGSGASGLVFQQN